MTALQIQSYLKFGYDVTFNSYKYKFDYSKIDKEKYAHKSFKELTDIGCQILTETLELLYDENQTVVVPISGGTDSRVLLGFMLQKKQSKDIKTYTFGVPNTFDFDIGNQIAKKHLTNHVSFNLNEHLYTEAELIETSKRMSHQSPLFFHPPIDEIEKRYKNDHIWSGVNAGAIVGSFAKKTDSSNLEEAKLKYLKKDIFKKKIKLHQYDDSEFYDYLSSDIVDTKYMSIDEQVIINERSFKYLAPHVLHQGFNYVLPFINTPFMDFMLSVPNDFRIGKKLYKAIAQQAFPELFTIPLEGNYGFSQPLLIKSYQKYIKLRQKLYEDYPRYLYYLSPMTNYFDLNKAFRSNKNLKEMVYKNLNDLKSRGLLKPELIDSIWQAHQSYKTNLCTEINLLFSLEIHLKAGK